MLVFSNSRFNANRLMEDALFLVWTWMKNLEKDFTTHYNQWSSNLPLGFRCSNQYEGRGIICNWACFVPHPGVEQTVG